MRGKNNLNQWRVSSDDIQILRKNEIFVFGSNKKGLHQSGAAKIASEKFGAQWGVGEGKTGKCYAIPTMEGFYSFHKAVGAFIKYATNHQNRIFLITKVGCGIAGYSIDKVAPMFHPCLKLPNVYLPYEFYKYYKNI